MEDYAKLVTLVTAVKDDLEKAVAGNRAAGTRVRKAMQEIKAQAQVIREKILELRGPGDAPAAPATPPPTGT